VPNPIKNQGEGQAKLRLKFLLSMNENSPLSSFSLISSGSSASYACLLKIFNSLDSLDSGDQGYVQDKKPMHI